MQKSFIILLAVCLISVHAFVKRDAPAAAPAEAPAKATETNYLEDLQKQFGDFSKQLNDKFRDTFNAEEINKGFSNAVNSVNKAFADLKPTSEPKKD